MLSAAFWEGADRLVFYLLFPALLLVSTAKAPLTNLTLLPLALATSASLLLISGLLFLLRRRLTADGPSFTSLFQGAIRQNSYLCFAVALALRGNAGVEALAVAVAIYVPIVNTLSIVVLVRYGSRGIRGGFGPVFVAVVKNPLMVSILLGLLINVAGIGLNAAVEQMLTILGQAALCLGLLAVGAGLDLRAARASGYLVGLGVAIKLAAMPAVALLACRLFGVDGQAGFALVLLAGSPTAGAAYIMARQMGGNAPLVANIITAQVLVSLASLPLVLSLQDWLP